VPKGDAKVIAATPWSRRAPSTRHRSTAASSRPVGIYTFFCSFPGHAALMKGKLCGDK
jgi:azurin